MMAQVLEPIVERVKSRGDSFHLRDKCDADERYRLRNLADMMRGQVEKQIVFQQSILKDILLWEELNYFSDMGVLDRDFVENELSVWLNYTTSDEKNAHIEKRLARIPFEQAYCYKNPDFHTKSRSDILQCVFGDSIEWRDTPALTHNLSIQEKLRIIKRFEYMCYYVINTREEILFDIQSRTRTGFE